MPLNLRFNKWAKVLDKYIAGQDGPGQAEAYVERYELQNSAESPQKCEARGKQDTLSWRDLDGRSLELASTFCRIS